MSSRKAKSKPLTLRNYWLIGSVLVVAAGLLYLVWATTRPRPEAFVSGSPGEPPLQSPAHASRG